LQKVFGGACLCGALAAVLVSVDRGNDALIDTVADAEATTTKADAPLLSNEIVENH
jgi:hypothetical protein